MPFTFLIYSKLTVQSGALRNGKSAVNVEEEATSERLTQYIFTLIQDSLKKGTIERCYAEDLHRTVDDVEGKSQNRCQLVPPMVVAKPTYA